MEKWKPVGRTVSWVGGRKVTKIKKEFRFVCDVDPVRGGRLRQPTLQFLKAPVRSTIPEKSCKQGYLGITTSKEGQSSATCENLDRGEGPES